MCERSDTLNHPTYQLRDLLVLLDDVAHRLSQSRPSLQLDEVIASVQQHRQMVARWLAHPPSRTVQANAASTILSVIASANAAAHAAHFDTGSWRPVQAELRAAQHSHPEANAALCFDLSADQGRGIAQAVLNDDLVPTPLDWLPKAGSKRVCEVHVEGIEEPLVLIAECVGIETPDGVLLALVPASQRQRDRVAALAQGLPVDARKTSRDELPTLTEDDIQGAERRRLAATRARASSHPALTASSAVVSPPAVLPAPSPTAEPAPELGPDTAFELEPIFDEPVFATDAFRDAVATKVDGTSPVETLSPVEALLAQYCADLEEPTAQTRIGGAPVSAIADTQPPPPFHPTQLPPGPPEPWRTPITLPPGGLHPTEAPMSAPVPTGPLPPALVPMLSAAPHGQTSQAPNTLTLETMPPPAAFPASPPPERVNTLVSPQDPPGFPAPIQRKRREIVKTQELPDLLFANAPVGAFTHHSDVAHIAPIGTSPAAVATQDRQTPVPTVVSLDDVRPAPRRRRRGGAMLLAAAIALGLVASPTPRLPTTAVSSTSVSSTTSDSSTTSESDVAPASPTDVAPAVPEAKGADAKADATKDTPEASASETSELVRVKRSLVRKLRK